MPELRFELGANLLTSSSTRFAVWAPNAKKADVQLLERIDGGSKVEVVRSITMERNADSFIAEVDDCGDGTMYLFSLDGQSGRPDPRSRYQPLGVHGPSEVVDNLSFDWTDEKWRGIRKRDLVIYELHVAAMTEEGDYSGVISQLDRLIDLGITAIELLPINQTPGNWNWGYDGVNFFAPRRTLGSPFELKQFIDVCHEKGLAVLLDVVYNHVGPEGNYLDLIAPYKSEQFGTPWGDSLDFHRQEVREFVIDNVIFWLDEYHFDGLRFDAVHYMFDESSVHVLDEIKQHFQKYARDQKRKIHLIGESNIYDPDLVGSKDDKENWDAIWSDCLMHSIYSVGAPDVRLTDRKYDGHKDVAMAVTNAYVFSTPGGVRVADENRIANHPDNDREYLSSLIMALQTHDSVGNHPHGKRLHQLASLEFQLAAAPLILLFPSIPMIFMGEEWATDAPFPFFADFEDQRLRDAVDKGRQSEYPHHDWKGSPLPSDRQAFFGAQPVPAEHSQRVNDWYTNLLALRKQGIAQEWLCPSNFSTRCDVESGIYQLIYPTTNGHTIHVCSRLNPADDDEKGINPPVTIPELETARIVLDSRPDSDANAGKLISPQCVIFKV